MAFPVNMLRIRNNGTVKPLDIPKDKLKDLQEFVSSNKHTSTRKQNMIKKIAGRGCCICGGIPSLQVSYDMQGATRIEKYCDNCIKSVYSREAVL
jgi:Translation machinery associated TMA7